MSNMNKKVFKVLGAWAFAMLFYLVPNFTVAQITDFDVKEYDATDGASATSDPSVDIDPNNGEVKLRLENFTGIDPNNPAHLYFYYEADGVPPVGLNSSNLLAHARRTNDNAFTIIGDLNVPDGNYNLYVAHYNARTDYENDITNGDYISSFGTTSNNYPYFFNGAGSREITTDVIDLSAETQADNIVLSLNLDLTGVAATNPVVVQFSTDGGSSWTDMVEDVLAVTDLDGTNFVSGVAEYSLQGPTNGSAISADAQFRIRQSNVVPLQLGTETFIVNSVQILKGNAPLFDGGGNLTGLALAANEIIRQAETTNPTTYVYTVVTPPAPPVLTESIYIFDILNATNDNVWANTGGFINVDAEETITIFLQAENYTYGDYEYFVNFNGVDYLVDAADLTINGVTGEIEIDFEIPNLPSLYNSLVNLEVKVVDGATIIPAAGGLNEFLTTDGTVTGGVAGGNDVDLTQAGTREVLSAEYEITSLTGLTLSFDLARLSAQVPPAGNEIVFEYTTDAGANWTEIETYELGGVNGVGLGGQSISFDETSPEIAGIVSAATQFRVRQESELNGAGIHTWGIYDFELNQPGAGGNTYLVTDNTVNDWIGDGFTYAGGVELNAPSFDLAYDDPNLDPIYAGQTVDIVVSNVSDYLLPGTVVEFRMIEGHGAFDGDTPGIQLASIDEASFEGTHSIEMPLVDGPQRIVVRFVYGDNHFEVSQSLFIGIQPLGVTVTDNSFDYEDSGVEFNVAGNTFDVDFDLTGEPVLTGDLNLSAALEINDGSGWLRIGDVALTAADFTAGNASVTGTIPAAGINDGQVDFRIVIENTPFNEATYTTDGGNSAIPLFGGMNGVGARDFTFLAVPAGGYLIPTLYIENADNDQDVFLQHNDGGTWTTVATYSVTAGFTGYLSQSNNLADTVAIPSTATLMRVYYNEDEISANGENVIYIGRYDIVVPHENSYNSITGFESIEVVYPSVALSTNLGGNTYFFEEAITAQYETTNIDASADLWFALVMSQGPLTNGVYHVLNESQDLNTVDLNVTFPTEAELQDLGFNTANSYEVNVIAYTQDVYSELTIADHSETFHIINDAVAIDGNAGNTFNQAGDRYVVSPSFDLSSWVGDITIDFEYAANVTVVNAQTLPVLEYSVDGGITYTELTVASSPYAGINRLPASTGFTTLTAEVPAVSADVRFRWSQEVTTGNGLFQLWNATISAGDDNRFDAASVDGFEIEYINMPQTIDLIEDNTDPYASFDDLDAYDFTLFDLAEPLDPAITVTEDFDFNWSYDLPTMDAVWPDSTVFEFFIVDGDDTDEDDYILFATVTDTGNFVGNVAELVETGIYEIYVRASLVDNGNIVYAYPNDGVNVDEFDYTAGLEIVSNELVINETTDTDVNSIVIDSPEEDDTFEIDQLFDVTYTTLGNFPTGVEFAVVLREPTTGEYEVLATGTDFGTSITIEDVQMIAQAWLDDNGDFTSNYELGVVAYEGSELIMSNIDIALDADDMILYEGDQNNLAFPGGLYFGDEGSRVALTRAIDLTGLVDPVLEFFYLADNITMSTSTLPRLEVSIDGGATFAPVEIAASGIGADGYLDNNGFTAYSIPIDPAYVTAATHFRWSQTVNLAQGWEVWDVFNINIASGNANVYVNKGNAIQAWIDVVLETPNLSSYDWTLVQDVNGFDPIIYNGSQFDFEWTLQDDELAFPVGTEFTFLFPWFDPFGGFNLIDIATIDAEGVHTADVPYYIDRNFYPVYVVNSYNDDIEQVGTITIYNEVLKTVYLPVNNNLFAGEEATFEAQLENTLNPDDYSAVWFNLVVDDNGEDRLLAAQQGLTNQFIVDLPAHLSGNLEFTIVPTEGAPMAAVGELTDSPLAPAITDAGSPIGTSDGDYATYTLSEEDLTDYAGLSFELDIEEALANLNPDQLIDLEYSVDGGQTYTLVASYPDARFNDPSYFTNDGWFVEQLNLTPAMRGEEVTFRWKVDETNGTSAVRNIIFAPAFPSFIPYPSLVLESTNVDVLPQRVDITSTDAFEYCLDGTIQFNYEIRGVFGDEAVVTLQVDNGGWQDVEVDGEVVEFTGITSGSGTIALDLANVDTDLSSGIFRLVVEDETVEDYEFTIDGNQNQVAIAIIPMFDGDTEFDVNTLDICVGDDVTVTINNAQEHFSYQLRDYVTGALVGPEVVADMNGALEVELGAISDNWTLEMIATAQTENGLVCSTNVPNDQLEINVRQESALYWDNDGEWTLVDGTEQLVACEATWTIAVGYFDNEGDFNAIDADFYRNDVNAQVEEQEVEYELPALVGNYFATFTDCDGNEAQTLSVELVSAYPQPTITVPATASCDAQFIELTADAGYAFYEWRRNGTVFNANNEASVTVTQGGTYTVRVSNTDIDVYGCASEWSEEVEISIEQPYRSLVWVDGAWDAVFAGQTVSVCGQVNLGYNNSTVSVTPSGNNNNILWYRDGVALQGVNTSNFTVTQPGTYEARYVSDNCDYTLEAIVVDFDNVPATPVLTVNGPTDFCEGEASLTLVAPAGFATYEWRRDGATVSNTGSTVNEFEVSASGSYDVRVVTANGCESLYSTDVDVTVHTLPTIHAQTLADVDLCEADEAIVVIPNGWVNDDVMYQLYDVVTGNPTGAARMGTTGANLVLTSDVITENAMLEVRAYRLNAQDCEAVSDVFEVRVYEMTISASGNTLVADITNPVGASYQWYRNGIIITNGGNEATLDIYDDADYFVEVTTANGCTLEDGFGKSKGGDVVEEAGMSVNVFPNPATNLVNVHYTSATEENVTITVVSVEGKVVYQAADVKTEGTFEHVIPVDQLTSGTYMIHVNGTQSQLVNKFIKQ